MIITDPLSPGPIICGRYEMHFGSRTWGQAINQREAKLAGLARLLGLLRYWPTGAERSHKLDTIGR